MILETPKLDIKTFPPDLQRQCKNVFKSECEACLGLQQSVKSSGYLPKLDFLV